MQFEQLFSNDLKALLPEFFLVFSFCALLVFASFYGTQERFEGKNPIILHPILLLSSQALLLASVLSFHGIFASSPLLYGSLQFDSLASTGKTFLFFTSSCVLLSSRPYLERGKILAFEYPLLILLSTLGMSFLLSSYDLLALYLSLELQSLSLYILASFQRGSAYSTEAGLKYFILGAFSSGLLLFGISLIYGVTGTTNYEDLNRLLLGSIDFQGMTGLTAGLIFVTSGILFKLAAAPFHAWIPDVYEGSPTSSTLFFATVPKIAVLISLIRLDYIGFYSMLFQWQPFLIVVSLLSLFISVLGAVYQRKIKRFLAYSSIGHIGYLLIGFVSGSLEGIESLLLYTLIYMIMSLSVWTILLTSARETNLNDSRDSYPIRYIDQWVLLGRSHPALGIALAITVFSMAGLPPFAGFYAKMYIFFAAMENALYLVAILAVLASVIGAFYYLRWVKTLYFEKEKVGRSYNQYYFSVDRSQSLILSSTSLFLTFYLLHPGALLSITHTMALSLCILFRKIRGKTSG